MSVLNQLYNGEIHPEENYRPLSPELIEAQREYQSHRDKLLEELDEKLRRRVLDLLEERSFVASYEMEDAFVQGMRLGARMAVELLGEEKKA